jgi:hypothetical protein
LVRESRHDDDGNRRRERHRDHASLARRALRDGDLRVPIDDAHLVDVDRAAAAAARPHGRERDRDSGYTGRVSTTIECSRSRPREDPPHEASASQGMLAEVAGDPAIGAMGIVQR